MQKISFVVPTYNEEGNIILFVQRINETFKKAHIQYEIIFIDDHSTDLTQQTIKKLQQLYPISLHLKQGRKGKAQSLLEGFSHASYHMICMIDADLQYPPEVVPEMIQRIEKGFDIVVANRKEKHTSTIRRIASTLCTTIFGKILHRLDCDIQSGLKVFKKEIVERIPLQPTSWTFDLEFLVKARDGGYNLATVDIVFSKRFAGKSKVNLVRTSWQIAKEAIKLKLKRPELIPFHKTLAKRHGNGFHYKGKPFIHFSSLDFAESAFFQLSSSQRLFVFIFFVLFFTGLLFNWHITIVTAIGFLTFIYFADLLFQLFLVLRGFVKDPNIVISHNELKRKRDWPTYTILCPLYKEASVLPQFMHAIAKLDYPKYKLQVLLLLEEDDKQTIALAKKSSLPGYVSLIITPHSFPKTKPKALNFGLQFATGEYSVIFDAEDIPDTTQLKKVVLAFEKSSPEVICMQAKLNFYNPYQNVLTRVFTAEYSLWFDLILSGLQSIHSIIPLGGTSNHFRTRDLQSLKGWDAFNVTEDADLGLRLAKHGYQTAMVNSTTLEEANSKIHNWFSQRGRWLKGYMQTYLVHSRNPRLFMTNATIKDFAVFQLVIGGKIISLFINPIFWIITFAYFAFRPFLGHFIESFFPAPIFYMGVLCMVFGNFLYMYYYMIGCAKRGYYSLIKYGFLVPFYWLCISVSGWQALVNIMRNPHYWAKTHHGFHLSVQKNLVTASMKKQPKKAEDISLVLPPVIPSTIQ